MSDERKIILQLQIDATKSITDLVTIKSRISALKEEQSKLNTETLEGKKTYEAYQAQIKALTKEQKSLELAVEKTAAGFQFETGSIASNRAELSKLTAEYKNIANPTTAQTKRIKDLSDRLKEQEKAIGDNRRNVGDYAIALNSAVGGSSLFGTQLSAIVQGMGPLTSGLKSASAGFKTLGGTIAATGIGLLIASLALVISYFKRTDDGATKLEGVMAAVGEVINVVAGYIAELGSFVVDTVSSVDNLVDAFINFGDFLNDKFIGFITTPFTLIKALLADVQGETDKAMKLYDKAVNDASFGIVNGVKNIGTELSRIASLALDAAKAAYEFAIAQDAINDAEREFSIQAAKNNQIVQESIKNAANKARTDEERIVILEKANKVEEQTFLKQASFDKQRLALITARNEREKTAINQRLQAQIAEAKTEEEKIKLQQKALSIQDKYADEQAKLNVKIINDETAFIALREKNQNKISALQEKIDSDNDKAAEEEQKRLKKNYDTEVALSTQRSNILIKNLEFEVQNTENSYARRTAFVAKKLDEQLKLEQQLTDESLTNLELTEAEKTAIIEGSEQRKLELIRDTEKTITLLQAQEQAERQKAEDKAAADRDKKNQQRLADFQKGVQVTGQITNLFFQDLLAANNLALQTALDNNDAARNLDLKKHGKTQADRDKINAKYDKLAAQKQKEAAKRSIQIQEIQAIAAGALAVVQAIASTPYPANLVIAALTAVGVGIEVALLEGQKNKLAKGGLVRGPSHAAGGVTGTGRFNNIEVEGDEFVVNKYATKRALPLLRQINSIQSPGPPITNSRGRAMRATGGFLDGGATARNAVGTTVSDLELRNQAVEIAKNIPPPIVQVEDVSDAQARKIQVRNRANL